MGAFVESIIIVAFLNAVLALGLYVTVMSGQLSAAHAAIAGAAGYAAGVLTSYYNIPFVVALVAGCVVAAAVGVAIALLTWRMSDLVGSLASLAVGQALAIVAFNIPFIGGPNGLQGIPQRTNLLIAALGLLIALWIVWRFEGSRLGLAAQAIRGDSIAAATSGIQVTRVRIITYGLGGAVAGLAGGLSAHYALVVVPNDLGFFASFSILIFVLFGGSYTMAGAVLGAMALTVLPQLLRFTIDFRFVLYGLLVVAVVLARPQGLITPRIVRRFVDYTLRFAGLLTRNVRRKVRQWMKSEGAA